MLKAVRVDTQELTILMIVIQLIQVKEKWQKDFSRKENYSIILRILWQLLTVLISSLILKDSYLKMEL